MNAAVKPDSVGRSISEARIPDDVFASMRKQNLARWPTGAEVNFEAAVERHRSLPRHKQLAWVMRKADAERRCLTQPRGGCGTFTLQKELMQALDRDGLADVVPTTTDSYTRNEQWLLAQKGIEETERLGRSMLNGYPLVNYGVGPASALIDAIDKPAILLTGTTMPKLTGEIGYAAGYSGYLGSGIAYTVSYIKELSIADGIRNYQYLDRLAAMYQDAGVELHRRQPGFLTGTNIPPSIAIITCVLDCLLAAAQGVRNYGLEMGQTMHLVQDAAATVVCRELCQEYLAKKGHVGIFTPVTLLHWMGAWPQDEAQSAALISYGGTLAAIAGAISVTTKTVHEAFGIPTPQANADGLRMTRMAIYLARQIRLEGLPEFEREKDLIRREVRSIVDRVLEMGDGDVAIGTVRAFEAGVLDIPWSPNAGVKSRVLPARDVDGYLRVVDPGLMPFPGDVMEFHRDRLMKRAEREGIAYGPDLAVESVYEIGRPIGTLLPDTWAI